MAKNQTNTIHDKPTEKDALDFDAYVDTLVDIIKNGETPLTIGIFGTWGSGKTSLMTMVRKKLPKKFTIVWFEAWKFDREETLWRVLLSRVLYEVRKSIPKDKIDDLQEIDDLETSLYAPVDREKVGGLTIEWGKMGEGIAESAMQIGLGFLPGGTVLTDLLKEFRNKDKSEQAISKLLSSIHRESAKIHLEQIRFLEQFHERFTKLVIKYFTEKKRRLIVFVDDLDRCLPEKAIEVLEAIKLFLDTENCIFVLGLDQDVIARGIEIKYKGLDEKQDLSTHQRFTVEGSRYLEKIIQLPFQIPPITKDVMGEFVRNLNKNWPHEECPEVFAEGLVDNPRQIKRTVNVFFMLWQLAERRKNKLKGKIKAVRLAKIVTIQSALPDLYNSLKREPENLQYLENYYIYRAKKSKSTTDTDDAIKQQKENQDPPRLPDQLGAFASNQILQNILSLHFKEENSEYNFEGLPLDELMSYFTLTVRVETPQVVSSSPNITDISSWYLAHPYAMSSNFTGRLEELNVIDKWLSEEDGRLLIIRALGGFGKSALAWRWINTHVDPTEWQKLIWWSFYEGDSSFENFVQETLKYLKIEPPQGQRTQVDELLRVLQSQKVMIVLDGFERALRAYGSMNPAYQGDNIQADNEELMLDAINANADIFLKSICSLPNIRSKVLMTTRLTPRAVKPRGEFLLGCHEEELKAMQKADAVEFFRKQGIRGTHTEIEAVCDLYGYHPLSLALLAGRILKDLETPGDIIVAQKIKIEGDLKQNQHHVLDVSYNSLPQTEQKLLSTIASFRGAVAYKTIESITENKDVLDDELRDLVARGLLHFDEKNKEFDLHPIVRRFSYDRLNAADRTGAHVRLVTYFEASPQPEKVTKLEELAPVIELYHHMVRAGNLDEAIILFRDRMYTPLYYQFGAYQLNIELLLALFPDGEDQRPRLRDESAQVWTLNVLATCYSLSGQPRRAMPLFETSNGLDEKYGNKKNLAVRLNDIAGLAQFPIGALQGAERNLRRSIELCVEIKEIYTEGAGRTELSRFLIYRGSFEEAEKEYQKAIELFEKGVQNNQLNRLLTYDESFSKEEKEIPKSVLVMKNSNSIELPKTRNTVIRYINVVWSYRSMQFLLLAREQVKSNKPSKNNVKLAVDSAERALELVNEQAKDVPVPRDYVRSYWLLGAAYRANSKLTLAEENLSKALNLCRQINLVEMEADILLELARLRYAQDDFKDAQEKASEALMITERSGYVLQGADVNLFLAQYALEQEKDKAKAKEYAEEAKKLATCDGPPYYYKVAYEEAERFLERLK